MSCENFLNDEKSKFSKVINRATFIFKNEEYEKKYWEYRFKHKNIIILIAITICFNLLIEGLENLEEFFANKFNIVKASDNPIRNATISIVEPLAGIALEIIIYFINKIRFLRGFSIIFSTMAWELRISLVYSSAVAHSSIPVFIPNLIFQMMSLIVICFLYSYNWICGVLQIAFIIGIIDYHIIDFAIKYRNSLGPLVGFSTTSLIVLSISVILSLSITIYYFELYQRKTFFRKNEAELQRKAIKNILEKLPDPLFIASEGDVKWKNPSLNKIHDDNNISYPNEIIRSYTERPAILGKPSVQSLQPIPKLKSKALNMTLEQVIQSKIELSEVKFKREFSNAKKLYYEISTINLDISGKKMLLFLMKNLTHFFEINKLKSKEKYQRIYFASISHDFRTPLSIISGTSELLMESEDDPSKRKSITKIFNASSILTLLVQDILDFSQLKSGTLKIHAYEFEIQKEFEIIIELFKDKYENKRLYLEMKIDENVPRIVFSDGNRLKQVLLNLISNAFKFTLKGGVIVQISYEIYSQQVIISVKDTGVGLSEEDKRKLFKEFGRLERHQSLNPNGVGLGLMICKQIIERLGGKITVESVVGEGTTFTFTFNSRVILSEQTVDKFFVNHEEEKINIYKQEKDLIRDNETREKTPKIHHTNHPAISNHLIFNAAPQFLCNCPKILCVDDDFSLRTILTSYCQKLFIPSEEAENGLVAIEKVTSKLDNSCCKEYDIIFLDFNMPFMNGLQTALEIKNKLLQPVNKMNIQTKIILLSGQDNQEEQMIDCENNSPFCLVVTKPLSFAKFKEIAFRYIFNKEKVNYI